MEETKKDDLSWWETKWHKAPANLNEAELLRLAEEQKQERLQREKDARETQLATQKRDEEYWHDIEKSCKDGTPEERFAVCLIRMSAQNLFISTLMPLHEKQRRIVQMLRLHGVKITDSKEKIPMTSYMGASDLFVSDPFVRKGNIVETRRSMFPTENNNETVGGEQ